MRAQVTLTPAEAKKLLAKGVASMPIVRKALKKGMVVIHPGSTSLFLVEELTGKMPEGVWVCGTVFPKGMCVSYERQQSTYLKAPDPGKKHDPGQFPFTWVLEKGGFQTGIPLRSILDKMGHEDVYVKGANAIDPEGRVGVLYASRAAGTIAKVIAASKRKGFPILLPIGLEKLIPGSLLKAAKTASRERTDIAMGIPVGLIPVPGQAVTEVLAIHLLSGAEAVVISAGGLAGAEGATTLVIQGTAEKVNRALEVIRRCKGATLPPVHPTDCSICFYPTCHYRGKNVNEAGTVIH